MSSFHFISFADTGNSNTHSHITSLEVIYTGGAGYLFSSTRFDGFLQQWTLTGGGIGVGDNIAFGGDLVAGGAGDIATIAIGAQTGILTGGAADGGLQLVTMDTNGAITGVTQFATLPEVYDGFQHTTQVTLDDGSQVVFGAFAGGAGIGRLTFDSSGNLTGHAILHDPTAGTSAQITAMETLNIGGQLYLFSISTAQNGMTGRKIGPDGGLSDAQSVGTEDGLWINAPSALATVTIAGTSYAIIGAAGTDSLSVVEIAQDGSMIVRDHVLDTRDTRFAGVTTIEIVTVDGKVYVIVAGSDDGVSVFMLLDGGMLIHRAQIEDTVDISLDNVSAIAGFGRGAGIDLFVASSSETGITQLRYDTGPAGVTATATMAGGRLDGTAGVDVLQGHNGNDVINAGAGDDILRDGAGEDVMTGGAGADVFILSQDGETDTITDFTLGEDTLDLSLWPMLRDKGQLYISLRSDGMQIQYGDETLIVLSSDGGPIDYRDLENADLIGATRFPTTLESGYPGPATPPHDTLNPDTPAPQQGNPYSNLTPMQIIGEMNLANLRGALDGGVALPGDGMVIDGGFGNDILNGADGFDLILTGGGNDTAFGRGGDDVILGRGGNDLLSGDDGADTLFGGAGHDTLFGGNGHDMLDGGGAADTLDGGNGDDILTGGAGADTFVFNAGIDRITDFEDNTDQILLDASLWTGLTSAEDLLMFYGEIDENGAKITFDDETVLFIDGVTDLATLADDLMLF